MEIKEIQKRNTEIISNVICDYCNKSLKLEEFIMDNEARLDHNEIYYKFKDYMIIEGSWGYESNKDMQHWKAVICEECVDEKLSFINFKKSKTRFGTINKMKNKLIVTPEHIKELANAEIEYKFNKDITELKKNQFAEDIKAGLGNKIRNNANKHTIIKISLYRKIVVFFKSLFIKF